MRDQGWFDAMEGKKRREEKSSGGTGPRLSKPGTGGMSSFYLSRGEEEEEEGKSVKMSGKNNPEVRSPYRKNRTSINFIDNIDSPKINGWIVPKNNRDSSSDIFYQRFKYYCENSSLNGCKYFTEDRRHWIERAVWIFLYLVMISGVAYVVSDVYGEYRRSPIITTEDKDPYPITKVAFPALAFCTLNRISYKSANALAESIFKANVSDYSTKEILDLLKYLGHLYDYTYSSFELEHGVLHEILKKFYDGEYDLNEIMKNLTPQCHEVILNCIYAGQDVSCTDIFTFRKTQNGYCCTFNYVRQSDEFIPATGYNKTGYQSKVLSPKGPGVNDGLSILIEPLLDDYYYTMPQGSGWQVIIFNSEDYPDKPSGGVIEQMITPSTETYLRLDAIIFFTPDEIIDYPVEKRKCIFNTELQKLFTGYTYSDCIVNCRMEDIWKTCNCLPFFFPKRDNRRTCDMADLSCLSNNKSKWWVLYPREIPEEDSSDPVLQDYAKAMKAEPASGIVCSECFPACNDVRYFVTNSVSRLSPSNQYRDNRYNTTSTDYSIVHVYFGNYAVPRLKQDVIYYWYELLSNIGGICGVFVGFSLISILEFLFIFIIPMLLGKGKGKVKGNGKENRARKKRLRRLEWPENTVQGTALYWEELQGSRSRRWRIKERKTAKKISNINQNSTPVVMNRF